MAGYEFRYRKPPRRKVRLSRVLMLLLILLLIAYPFFEAYHLTIDRHSALIANLPVQLKNLTIVYATDIHQSDRYSQSMVNRLVRTINGLSADLVLLGGDYADDSAGAIVFFRNLPQIQARLGVYGVLGKHDRTPPANNYATLVKAMTNAGVVPLTNSVSRIKMGKTYLYIAGVDDYANGIPDVQGVASQLTQDDFVIFLGHTPDLLTDAIKATGADGDNHWFDIALFGQTHGGQVTLFGLPLLADFIPEIGDRYLSGWLEENRASILISNGVGTEMFPARICTPSQIHLITLKSKAS